MMMLTRIQMVTALKKMQMHAGSEEENTKGPDVEEVDESVPRSRVPENLAREYVWQICLQIQGCGAILILLQQMTVFQPKQQQDHDFKNYVMRSRLSQKHVRKKHPPIEKRRKTV